MSYLPGLISHVPFFHQHAIAHFRQTGHPVATSFGPREDWFHDCRSGAIFNGPARRGPHMRPVDQPAPGPADQVRRSWMDLLND